MRFIPDWRISLCTLCAVAGVSAQTTSPIVVGSISSTAAVLIGGTAMAAAASPSWALVDGDEVGTTSAPALMRTAGQNVVTLQPASKARIRSLQRDQIYVYLREGGLSFEAKTPGIAICAADRLYIPAPLAKGAVVLEKSGQVARSLKAGSFAEDGVRACGAAGIAGDLTGLPGAAAAGSSATGAAAAGGSAAASGAAAGGSAIGAGAGAVGAGAAAGAAGTAAAAVGVGSAAAIGAASGASASTSSNANPPSVSPSTP